jgi:RNA polymerase sigma factor (TIGR02999 family)
MITEPDGTIQEPEQPASGEVTQLLRRLRAGEPHGSARLYALVYQELHRLAARQLRGAYDGRSATTSLVHETYLKLIGSERLEAEDRGHLLAIAARAMRQILIDRIRRAQTEKRGAGRIPIELDELVLVAEDRTEALLAVDQALRRLEALDPRLAQVVELRFFGGLELTEIGALFERTERTIKRDWRKARALLAVYLEQFGDVDPGPAPTDGSAAE